MSTQTEEKQDETMGTKPVEQHEWLKKLLGEWRTESEMVMSEGKTMKSQGTEKVYSLGGLWAFGEGKAAMPDGDFEYRVALGYDVSFKEYRGCMIMSASSHLWKQTGTLSADGKTMTLNCIGPNMVVDGETANYRDIIEIIDDNHRTLTSMFEDDKGVFQTMMKCHYTRV
ncbi:MAG TPA: DUF1579 domain-containing protein [Fimbriimonadaceae bacterium]